MGKRTKTDGEQLTDGLIAARAETTAVVASTDDDIEVPQEIGSLFASYTVDQIKEQITNAKALGLSAVIRLGFAYLGLKSKLDRNFKKTIVAEEGKKGYMAAWRAMCRAQAFLRVPEVAGELGIRTIVRIASLSADDVLSLRAKLIESPPEVVKSITEEMLDEIDDKRREEKERNAAGRRRQKSKPLPPENTDKEWVVVKDQWARAVVEIEKLVGACRKVKEWKSEYVDEALEKKMVVKIGEPYDDVIKFLHPIEEIRRRGLSED